MRLNERLLSEGKLLCMVITIAFCAFILPINEHLVFTIPTDRKRLVLSYILKLLFVPFFYFLTRFIYNFALRIKNCDSKYKTWLKVSLTYFIILLILFVLIYPGHWVWDEFQVLSAVKTYDVFSWQHYFTEIYYTFCLYIIPTGIGIVLLQMVFVSAVVGYVISHLQVLFKRKRLAYLLIVPFLFFPVLLNNLYPLRLTVYSYIELILIFKLISMHFGINKPKNKYYELILMSFLITLLAFWRTEGIFYLILLPYILIKLKIINKSSLRNAKTYVALLITTTVVLAGYFVTNYTSDPLYQVTATINPLSTMIPGKLAGREIQKNLDTIDKVVDLKVVKKYPNYNEIDAFWYGAVRPDFKTGMNSYNKAFLYVIVNNPNQFFDNRVKTFLSTNSLDTTIPQVGHGYMAYFTDSANVTNFIKTNYLSKPINASLKSNVTNYLLTADDKGHNTMFSPFVWTILPTLVLLFVLLILKLIQKQLFWLLPISLLLTRTLLLFLTSPANYFMYYLPVYLCGNFIITLVILLYFEGKYNARKVKK